MNETDYRFKHYKLYLRKFCGSYEDAKPFDSLEKLLNTLNNYFYDYVGYLIIAWDSEMKSDIIITSGDFDNHHYDHPKKEDQPKKLVKKNNNNNKGYRR